MSGNRRPEDEFFDDIEAEEARAEEQEQAELEAAEAETATEADSNDPAQILSVLDKLKAENEELKDRTLRTIAEMDNLRKRNSPGNDRCTLLCCCQFCPRPARRR